MRVRGTLRIHLFGTVRVGFDDAPGARLTHGLQALLAYLMLHRGRRHHRESLAGVFWGELSEDRARGCLSTALWRLRHALEPAGTPRGTYLVVARGGEVGFNQHSDHWLDVAEVESGVRRLHGVGADLAAAEDALAQYTGDLLDGFYVEWALRERERLRLVYLDGLSRLMDGYAGAGDVDRALSCAYKILQVDPLREEVHRAVIRLHVGAGRRAAALEQYGVIRDLLARELGVEPMPETRPCARVLPRPTAPRPSRSCRVRSFPPFVARPAPWTRRGPTCGGCCN